MRAFDAKIPDEFNIGTEAAKGKSQKEIGLPSALLVFRLMIASILCGIVPILRVPSPQSTVIFLVAGGIAGADFVYDGVKRMLLEEQYFNRNAIVTLIFLVSFIIGVGYEGTLLMILTQLGSALTAYVRGKTREHISGLTGLMYETARVQTNGDISEKFIDEVRAGDTISVHAGEDFPLDCIVMEGNSTMDVSRITGSAKTVNISIGDAVLAGSHNIAHDVLCEVTSDGSSTATAILQQLRQPQDEEITPVFRYLTPCLMLLSFVYGVAIAIMGHTDAYEAIHRTLVLFTLSSALPAFTWIGEIRYAVRAGAAVHGILYRDDSALKAAEHCTSVLFSAEGTLTAGKQKVVSIQSDRMDSHTFLKIAAHAMAYSKEASADAVIKAYGGPIDIDLIQDFVEIPHCGVKVIVDGIQVILGTQALLAAVGRPLPNHADNSVLFMIVGNQVAGTITLSDPIRKSAGTIVSKLEEVGIQHTEFVISYSTGIADKLSQKSGIAEYKTNCGEDAKLRYVETFKFSSAETVMYVCDQKWHGSAHSAADLDVVVDCLPNTDGSGTADVLLPGSRPVLICDAVRWSRKARRNCSTAMGIALIIKGVLMLLAALGLTTVWFSAFTEGAAMLAVGVFSDKCFFAKSLK